MTSLFSPDDPTDNSEVFEPATFLHNEIFGYDFPIPLLGFERCEHIENHTIKVPAKVEKLMAVGFILLFDAFLFELILMPIRVIYSLFTPLWRYLKYYIYAFFYPLVICSKRVFRLIGYFLSKIFGFFDLTITDFSLISSFISWYSSNDIIDLESLKSIHTHYNTVTPINNKGISKYLEFFWYNWGITC